LFLVLSILWQEHSQALVNTPLGQELVEFFLDVDVQLVKLGTNVEAPASPISVRGEVGREGGIFVEAYILHYDGAVLDETFKVESTAGRL
jgi:hypothetical protein